MRFLDQILDFVLFVSIVLIALVTVVGLVLATFKVVLPSEVILTIVLIGITAILTFLAKISINHFRK